MVEVYLEEIHQKLLEQKQKLEHEITKTKYEIEEDKQFIRMLDDKTDQNFESLSPRIINEKNKSKIKELQIHMENSKVSCETLESQLIQILDDLKQCESVLQCEKERKEEFEKMEELANRYTTDSLAANKNENFDGDFVDEMIRRIQFCIDLSIMDSRRCKIELIKIRDELSKEKEI